jgi:hypothetical protein
LRGAPEYVRAHETTIDSYLGSSGRNQLPEGQRPERQR